MKGKRNNAACGVISALPKCVRFDLPRRAADTMATCSDGEFISTSSGGILITE